MKGLSTSYSNACIMDCNCCVIPWSPPAFRGVAGHFILSFSVYTKYLISTWYSLGFNFYFWFNFNWWIQGLLSCITRLPIDVIIHTNLRRAVILKTQNFKNTSPFDRTCSLSCSWSISLRATFICSQKVFTNQQPNLTVLKTIDFRYREMSEWTHEGKSCQEGNFNSSDNHT